jgi:hypothetical protein
MNDAGDDFLVQVHIPKCAGTAVAFWMMKAAVEGVLAGFGSLYRGQQGEALGAFDDETLWAECLNDPRMRAASSHDIRRYPAAIRGRRMHYFTILRHPLANFLSAVRYMQQDRLTFGVPDSVGNSSREMTNWILSRPLGQPFRENNQTNHLALYPWCDTTGGRLRAEEYGSWDPADQAAYQRDRVALAKRILESFLVVGTLERLPLSLGLVRKRSSALGIQLPPVEELGHNNTTTVPLDDVSWIQTEELGRRLLDAVTADWEVYEHGTKLLDAALAAD